jgi:hypothetical protein
MSKELIIVLLILLTGTTGRQVASKAICLFFTYWVIFSIKNDAIIYFQELFLKFYKLQNRMMDTAYCKWRTYS